MIQKMLGINPDQIKQVAEKMQSDLTFFRESLDYHSDQIEYLHLKMDAILNALGVAIPEQPTDTEGDLSHD